MMNNQLNRFTFPEWLKWVIGIILLMTLACFIFSIYLYQTIQEDRTTSFDDVRGQILQTTELNTISNIERFHGQSSYYIAQGKTADEADKIVFHPFNQDESDVMITDKSEIITKDTMHNNWRSQCVNCNLIDINPAITGVTEKQPSWEITYEETGGDYVITYYSMADGKQIETLQFNQIFGEDH